MDNRNSLTLWMVRNPYLSAAVSAVIGLLVGLSI